MFPFTKAKIDSNIKKIKHVLGHLLVKSDNETIKIVKKLLLTITPINWGLFLVALMVLGIYLCKVTSYSLPMFFFVFAGLNSISTISLFSERKFRKDICKFKSEILGSSESYIDNANVSSLIAKYDKKWNISGDVLLKSVFTIFFFSIIGIGLLGKYPPNLILAFFLLIFILAVGISMIGYFQYEALYRFILEFPDVYKPSCEKFFWITPKRYAWVAQLAKLYDFYSTVFFVLALLYALGCYTFCFCEHFAVIIGPKSLAKIILLMVFWLKILYELVVRFIYKLWLGKKKLASIENVIKDNFLNIIEDKFDDPIISEKDYGGFGLYLQLQQICIIPQTNRISDSIKAVSYVANTIVTFSSLYALVIQAF